MKVVFPTGQFISPGFQQIHTVRQVETEVWYMGHFIETLTEDIHEFHGVDVPEPPMDENGEFTFASRTWVVIRDDSPIWDREIIVRPTWRKAFLADNTEVLVLNSNPDDPGNHIIRTHTGGKAGWLARMKERNSSAIAEGVDRGWWDLSPNGDPQKPAKKISIAEMLSQNKTLMAHLMVDLGFFPSVGQARKNGWDKPLELGRYELGPRKKREFVEIIP